MRSASRSVPLTVCSHHFFEDSAYDLPSYHIFLFVTCIIARFVAVTRPNDISLKSRTEGISLHNCKKHTALTKSTFCKRNWTDQTSPEHWFRAYVGDLSGIYWFACWLTVTDPVESSVVLSEKGRGSEKSRFWFLWLLYLTLPHCRKSIESGIFPSASAARKRHSKCHASCRTVKTQQHR